MFKKTILLSALAMMIVACSYSQGAKPAPATDSIPYHVKLYQNAMVFGDLMVAKEAMFNLITQNPGRIDYIDSLARLYYSLGSTQQALLSARIVLEKQADNEAMLEITGICYDALGSKKEALDAYEKLYAKSKNVSSLYQIAVLQYSLQRVGECTTTCDNILKDPSAATSKITISYDQYNGQDVPISAAIQNLKGVMAKDAKDDAKATTYFEEALKVFPEFELAKNNLEFIKNPPKEEEPKDKKKK